MVALLVAMSIMAIMMAAVMPAWHTMAQREKEAELVFRGEQIARAIGLYQRRFANAPAPSVDFLVEQRFLRKKYKDPITNDDFQVLSAGANAPGQVQGRSQGAASTTPTTLGRGQGSGLQTTTGRAGTAGSAQGFGSTTATGGVVGVTSKSPLKSLRVYNGQDTYNQWVFLPVAQAARAGGPGGGAGGRGADGRGVGTGAGGRGRGGPPQGPGGTPQGPPARGRF
jgi:type II secretory pathway pseudopilin PulG